MHELEERIERLQNNLTELEEKFERLQNNLERPQMEDQQNKIKQLEYKLKWCVFILIIIIAVMAAPGLLGHGHTVAESEFNVSVQFSSTPDDIIDEVKAPQGIAFHHKHDIMIVAEYTEHRLAVFNRFSRKKIATFGSKGSGSGDFNHPSALAVDDDGNILVADQKNHRIQNSNTWMEH